MSTIAVNRWLFRDFPVEQWAKAVSEIGYNGVELAASEVLGSSRGVLQSLRTHLDTYDLEVSAVNAVVSFVPYIHGSITDKILRRREEFLRQLESIIGKMSDLRCSRFLVSPGIQAGYQTRDEAWKTTVESLKRLGEYAASSDMQILLEAMPFRRPFCSSREIRQLVDETALPNIGAAMDTSHIRIAEEALKDAAETLGSQLRYLHLSNIRVEQGRPVLDEHRPLDDGIISASEYAALLSALKEWRNLIPLAVNVVTLGDPVACAQKCLQLIRNWASCS